MIMDDDNEALMDHVALEMMNAIESKDKEMFIDCLHTLVADLMQKMKPDMDEGDSSDVNG